MFLVAILNGEKDEQATSCSIKSFSTEEERDEFVKNNHNPMEKYWTVCKKITPDKEFELDNPEY